MGKLFLIRLRVWEILRLRLENEICELWGLRRGDWTWTGIVAGHGQVLLGLRIKKHFIFCIYSTPLTELIRFGWGLVGFRFLKPKPNQILKKIIIGLIDFFGYFFLGLIGFSVFLLTPRYQYQNHQVSCCWR